MSIVKKAASAIITAVLLTGCEASVYDYNVSSDSETDNHINDEQLYSDIVEELEAGSSSFSFEGTIGFTDIKKAHKKIEQKYPEFFWIDSFVTVEENNSITCEFDSLSDYSSEELLAMLGELESAADKIIAGMPDGLDDFGKVIYIHDYIAENTVYDEFNADNDISGLWDTSYGCLVQGKAICGGYAEGFSYMMKCLGIESGVVTGDVTDENGEISGHAWNYINLNGRYYWLDVTWDDTDDKNNPFTHMYCIIDDARMNKNRILDENQYFIPLCYSMEENYYVRNNSYITIYTKEAVGEAITSSPDSDSTEMMFADKSAYEAAVNGLLENGELWELTDYAEISDTVNYMKNDDMYVLSIQY